MNRLRSIDWGDTGKTLYYRVVAEDTTTVLIPRSSTGIMEFPAGSGSYQKLVDWNPSWVSGTEVWDDGVDSVAQIFNTSQLVIEDEPNPDVLTASILSLSTIAEANAYFSNYLYADAWFNSTLNKCQQCLNQATKIINRFNYFGSKTVSTQSHEWPRTGIYFGSSAVPSDIIPSDILAAQYEIALALAKGYDPEREIRNLHVTSRGYSSVRTTYDPRLMPEHLAYGVPSALAWSYLSTYFNRSDSGIVKIHRVN